MENGDEPSIEAMKDRVYALNRMSAAIHEERSALEKKIAEALAVWKLGQRVPYRDRSEYEITNIKPGYSVGSVKYFGRKVLKSGKLHANTTELWFYDAGRDIKAATEQQPVTAPL